MAQANSQWLASLHYAFQDKEKLYLVMEFYPGGDLLTVMQRYEGQLTEQHARFYLSEISKQSIIIIMTFNPPSQLLG